MFFFEPWLVGFFGTAVLSRLPLGSLRAVLPTIAYALLFVPAFYSHEKHVTAFWPFIVVFVLLASSAGSGMLEVLRGIGTSARRSKQRVWPAGWNSLGAGLLELLMACGVAAVAFAACVAVDEPHASHSQYCSYLARGLAVAAPLYVVVERQWSRPRVVAGGVDAAGAMAGLGGTQEEGPTSITDVVVSRRLIPFHLRPRWRVAIGRAGVQAVVDAPFLSHDSAHARARELVKTLDDRRSSFRLPAARLQFVEESS